jgi:hypothetical protein
MKQKKIISLPTNEEKIYKQILAFLGFMMNITSQDRDILAELIKLDNEYEMLPLDKRGKFILSTDMRKEIQKKLDPNVHLCGSNPTIPADHGWGVISEHLNLT